jgi:hypothetical protein
MDEREIQKILTEILFAEIHEAESSPDIAQKITHDVLISVCRLAKQHDLVHIVSRFVYKNKIQIAPKLAEKLQREEYLSVYRYERMKHAFDEICNTFDEARIAYVPLKGSVIRPYYPYESMRTSCDIDILIHESDLQSAILCLQNKGYRCENKNYHDVSLYLYNEIHLELHFNILENIDSLDSVLKDAWNYTALEQGSRYAFTPDFFVFYVYAHMAYHFLAGGCGIRSLLDIWIVENKMGATYLHAEKILKKAGIYTFAKEMSSIANKCFTENDTDEFSDLALKYIYSGGLYGTDKNKIAMRKCKTKNSFSYAIERLFLPYNRMVSIYPILKKLPILLPFCWMIRCIFVVFQRKTKRISDEWSYVKSIPDNTVTELTELRSRLDI